MHSRQWKWTWLLCESAQVWFCLQLNGKTQRWFLSCSLWEKLVKTALEGFESLLSEVQPGQSVDLEHLERQRTSSYVVVVNSARSELRPITSRLLCSNAAWSGSDFSGWELNWNTTAKIVTFKSKGPSPVPWREGCSALRAFHAASSAVCSADAAAASRGPRVQSGSHLRFSQLQAFRKIIKLWVFLQVKKVSFCFACGEDVPRQFRWTWVVGVRAHHWQNDVTNENISPLLPGNSRVKSCFHRTSFTANDACN